VPGQMLRHPPAPEGLDQSPLMDLDFCRSPCPSCHGHGDGQLEPGSALYGQFWKS
jgi:hypothetical protein